ncbi:TolC family protein [Polaromonas jejuensis]|uniref:TolC family protein n=1 Tax=Polaromonas jejuensis TaxID=457502 RepID=A0ABW0QD31_9BURK|nr:TolC family protein [Polaromonas jejuensis]
MLSQLSNTTYRVVAAAASALVFLAAALPLHAQPAGRLSLDEALDIAQGNAPALSAAADGAQAAREMAVAAGQLPDPVLRLGVDNLPVNGADRLSLSRDFMTMRRIGVMQEYVSADKRALQRRRGELDAVRQDAARHSLAANLRRDVATAWFDRYYAVKSREILKTLETELELQLRTLDAQLRAGKASVAESPMATAVLLQTHDRILVVDKQERLAQIALARWLGKEAAREPGIAPNIEALALDPANPAVVASVPSVQAHASEREVAQADLAIAELNKRPNWSWELAYSQRGSAYSNMVSFGVSIPLPTNASNKQDRDIAAKQAQVQQANALHEDMRRETQAGVSSAYAEWQSLVERHKKLADALLPVARQRIDLSLAAYRGGQGTLASVLEARRAEVEAQLQLLDLQREIARLWAQLQYVYAESAKTHAEGVHP